MTNRVDLDEPFDPQNGQKHPNIEPKDAATLILVRGGREVMMGQRAKGHVFFPDKWVFPGGRLEAEDAAAPAASEFDAATETLLRLGAPLMPPRAYGLAAARETLEETGLRVGGPEGPALDRFRFVCRAITPPNRPRRFDARFFLADAGEVLLDDKPVRTDDELLDVKWFSFEEAEALDLPTVTRYVLKEVRAQLAGSGEGPPFLCWRDGGHQMERLKAGVEPFGGLGGG